MLLTFHLKCQVEILKRELSSSLFDTENMQLQEQKLPVDVHGSKMSSLSSILFQRGTNFAHRALLFTTLRDRGGGGRKERLKE